MRFNIFQFTTGVVRGGLTMLFFTMCESLFYSTIIFFLWNIILPTYGVPPVQYWDVFGVLIIIRLIFQYSLLKVMEILRLFIPSPPVKQVNLSEKDFQDILKKTEEQKQKILDKIEKNKRRKNERK